MQEWMGHSQLSRALEDRGRLARSADVGDREVFVTYTDALHLLLPRTASCLLCVGVLRISIAAEGVHGLSWAVSSGSWSYDLRRTAEIIRPASYPSAQREGLGPDALRLRRVSRWGRLYKIITGCLLLSHRTFGTATALLSLALWGRYFCFGKRNDLRAASLILALSGFFHPF